MKLDKLYKKWMNEYCHCYTDKDGKTPCDNGEKCNRCQWPDAQEVWAKMKEENEKSS